MTTGKIVLVTVLAGAISIGFAIFGQQWLRDGRPIDIPLSRVLEGSSDRLDRLPEFRLPDVDGNEIASSAWAGRVLVLNFWATWCPPCLREMPLFAQAQAQNEHIQVVGIAIDTQEEVKRFLEEHPVNFPILLGDERAIEMSRRLGNRLQGLPFTAIFDSRGKRVYGRVGEMTRASLDEQIVPLLPNPMRAQTAANESTTN